MYIIIFIDDKLSLTLFYVVYDAQDRRGVGFQSLIVPLLFEIIWNSEDQNIEFDNPKQNPGQYNLLRL